MRIELLLKAEDEADQAIWNWLAIHPKAKITARHSVKALPLQMEWSRPFRRIEARDQFSLLIEYEED